MFSISRLFKFCSAKFVFNYKSYYAHKEFLFNTLVIPNRNVLNKKIYRAIHLSLEINHVCGLKWDVTRTFYICLSLQTLSTVTNRGSPTVGLLLQHQHSFRSCQGWLQIVQMKKSSEMLFYLLKKSNKTAVFNYQPNFAILILIKFGIFLRPLISVQCVVLPWVFIIDKFVGDRSGGVGVTSIWIVLRPPRLAHCISYGNSHSRFNCCYQNMFRSM